MEHFPVCSPPVKLLSVGGMAVLAPLSPPRGSAKLLLLLLLEERCCGTVLEIPTGLKTGHFFKCHMSGFKWLRGNL